MEVIEIAKVIKPQGIKGEVKAQHYCDNPDVFFDFDKVFIKEDEKYIEKKILETRVDRTYVYLYLDGVYTRDDAESLRGTMFYVEKSEIKNKNENSFLIRDIIGVDVLDEDSNNLGKLTEVLQHGAVDVYRIKSKDNCFMFPALKRVVKKIDIDSKTMVLNKDALKEVVVYDV